MIPIIIFPGSYLTFPVKQLRFRQSVENYHIFLDRLICFVKICHSALFTGSVQEVPHSYSEKVFFVLGPGHYLCRGGKEKT